MDSFPILALLQEETGAGEVARLLREATEGRAVLHMCVINVGEVIYRAHRLGGGRHAEQALQAVHAQPIHLHEATTALTMEAAALKARLAMSYADCFAVALAKRLDAAVVTGDPEFRQVEPEVPIVWLERR